MIETIKAKLLPVMAAIIGILAVAASFLLALLQGEKKKAAQQEKSDLEAAKKQQDRATEAYIKGITNEQDNTSPRSYDFHD